MTEAERTSLGELASLFLRLGATSFGGPAAHIAMIHDEVVLRRRWLTEERFLDLLAAANLVPGPTSTELAIHVGWERRRLPGLLVAGVCFIVPAMLMTGALGFAYVRFGRLPAAAGLLRGVKPVVVAVVAQAIWTLFPKAARSTVLRVLGAVALACAALGVDELVVLFGTGLAALLASVRGPRAPEAQEGALFGLASAGGLALAAGASPVTLPAIFRVFLEIGAVLFGSGYVLLAFLRAHLVEQLHWMTESQLLDAVAVGQVTPGPVFTTATFIGYVLAGTPGALVATAGIFVPAFVFVGLSGPLLPLLRRSRLAGAFLDGVNVASLALMIAVTAQIARASLVDAPAIVLAVASLVLLLRFRVSATWLVLGGATAGLALSALGR